MGGNNGIHGLDVVIVQNLLCFMKYNCSVIMCLIWVHLCVKGLNTQKLIYYTLKNTLTLININLSTS